MALLSCRTVDQIWMSRNPLYSHFFWLKCASPPPSLVSNYKAIVELSVAKSQRCPFGFGRSLDQPIVQSISHFFVGLKKLTRLKDRTFFLSTLLNFFVHSFLKIGHCLISRLNKNKLSRLWDKSIFFGATKKKWEIDWTIGWPRDWPKPHGRHYWNIDH